MNEICIQILSRKLAEIKELTESLGVENLSAAVQELEEAVARAQRILQGEDSP